MASVFAALGYAVVRTPFRGDHGIALNVESQGERAIVHCKHGPAGAVGEPVLRDLYGTLHHDTAQTAYLVTTSSATPAARGWAKDKPIQIWAWQYLTDHWSAEVAELATSTCCVRLEEVAPAVRMGAVDVIHRDVSKWGGIEANRKLAVCCEAFGLGMSLHSGGELGIGTACHLQLAAATPQIAYAIDSMYDLLADDVIAGPMLRCEDGSLAVPQGPGVGVELDEEKLQAYQALYAQEGEPLL